MEDSLILLVLTKAKELYLKFQEGQHGMCIILECVLREIPEVEHLIDFEKFSYLQRLIPKFNPEFLEADYKQIDNYWWDRGNLQARIEAFDKLIKEYGSRIQH